MGIYKINAEILLSERYWRKYARKLRTKLKDCNAKIAKLVKWNLGRHTVFKTFRPDHPYILAFS